MGPLFQTRCVVNTNNYGCYSSKTAGQPDRSRPRRPRTPRSGGALWHQADEHVMQNAVIVPLGDGQAPFYSSARVQNADSSAIVYAPNIGGPDITNVWLNPNKP